MDPSLEQSRDKPFSAIQYYFAHARNVVHLAIACPQDVSEDAFRSMVGRITEAIPQVWFEESLERNAHADTGIRDPAALIDYERAPVQSLGPADLDRIAAEPLHDTGRPAARAICRAAAAPDARGVRTWIVLQATHAMSEGGDITKALRGHGGLDRARPIVDAAVSPWLSALIALLAPFIWLPRVLRARRGTLTREDFGFRRVALDHKGLARSARTLGVSKRALLIGLLTYALIERPNGDRRQYVGYSIMPRERVRLSDDDFINARLDDIRLTRAEDPESHVRAMAEALKKRGRDPVVTQALLRRFAGFHQRAHQNFPSVFPDKVFGFSAFDFVISMIQPVHPGRFDPLLADGTIFAGTASGTTPTCIIAPGRRVTTLGLYLPPTMRARLPNLMEIFAGLGIEPELWGDAAAIKD